MKSRIVIIDDDSDSLKLATYLLTHQGFQVQSAQDGEAGLALIYEVIPDIILSDVQLPKLTGLELVKKIKSNPAYQHIPMIAITAQCMAGDKENILAAGFDGYISKPIDPMEFTQQIIDLSQTVKSV